MNTNDLDRIRQRLGTTSYSPWKDDTFALLYEVERLRADVQSYRALADDYAEEFEAVCAERDVRRARQRHVRAERDRLAETVERVRALIAEWENLNPASGPFPDRVVLDVDVEVINPLRTAIEGTDS